MSNMKAKTIVLILTYQSVVLNIIQGMQHMLNK